MDRLLRFAVPSLVLALVVGCGAPEEPAAPSTPAPAAPGAPDAPAGDATPTPDADAETRTGSVELSEEELANIKQLADAGDQAAAIKQAVCPVSEEHLGAMDAPIKASIGDRTFFLCCKGCESAVSKEPEKVIAKLDEIEKK